MQDLNQEFSHLHLNRIAHPVFVASMIIPIVIFLIISFVLFETLSKGTLVSQQAYKIDTDQQVLSVSTRK